MSKLEIKEAVRLFHKLYNLTDKTEKIENKIRNFVSKINAEKPEVVLNYAHNLAKNDIIPTFEHISRIAEHGQCSQVSRGDIEVFIAVREKADKIVSIGNKLLAYNKSNYESGEIFSYFCLLSDYSPQLYNEQMKLYKRYKDEIEL